MIGNNFLCTPHAKDMTLPVAQGQKLFRLD